MSLNKTKKRHRFDIRLGDVNDNLNFHKRFGQPSAYLKLIRKIFRFIAPVLKYLNLPDACTAKAHYYREMSKICLGLMWPLRYWEPEPNVQIKSKHSKRLIREVKFRWVHQIIVTSVFFLIH